MKQITNDDTKDISRRIIELLEDRKIVKFDYNEWDWDLQDSIHGILNSSLNIIDDDGTVWTSKENK